MAPFLSTQTPVPTPTPTPTPDAGAAGDGGDAGRDPCGSQQNNDFCGSEIGYSPGSSYVVCREGKIVTVQSCGRCERQSPYAYCFQ